MPAEVSNGNPPILHASGEYCLTGPKSTDKTAAAARAIVNGWGQTFYTFYWAAGAGSGSALITGAGGGGGQTTMGCSCGGGPNFGGGENSQ